MYHNLDVYLSYVNLLETIVAVLQFYGLNLRFCLDYSGKSLLDLVDHLGPFIKVHLHFLIPKMLENVSEIDVSEINKLSVQYTEQSQIADVIENVREEIVNSHFSTDIIKRVCTH